MEEQLAVVESITLEAQLVIAGFSERNDACLFVVNEEFGKNKATLRRDSNFVAIGSGAPAANVTLYRREHIGRSKSLMETLYVVYEAMQLSGEISPGVGKSRFPMDILSPHRAPQSLADAGYDYLANRYKQFGPKQITEGAFNAEAAFFGGFTGESRAASS